MSATGEWVIQIHNDRMETDAEYAAAYERRQEEEAAYFAAEQQEEAEQPDNQPED